MTFEADPAAQFEQHRDHLHAVAYRMLGSSADADDAVQEAWLRLSRADTDDVANMRGWLTTVVSRICLDALRARRGRREEFRDGPLPEPMVVLDEASPDPEQEVMMADAVGLALLVVLETLAPAERLAFVLHDMFGVSFEEIAQIVDRNPAAARQLASRARRRVRGGASDAVAGRVERLAAERKVVDAFLAASREGDFDALVAVLDPDVVLRVDRSPLTFAPGAVELTGSAEVAAVVLQRGSPNARFARRALVDGRAGAAVIDRGTLRSLVGFTIENGRITAMDLVIDPETLANVRI
jgi:RNA polymerase sigma-70 factor (ECF subfamily)